MAELRNHIVEAGSKANMRKTTIGLTEEQYFFLKAKALEPQRQNQNASIVSIIPDLVEKKRQKWNQRKVSKADKS